jgi:hypothetical protein
MRLIKLHRVLVVGGAALVASCGDSGVSQQRAATNLTDAAPNDDSVEPSIDAAPQADAQGVDAWLSWVVTADAAETGDAHAGPGDAGSTADADRADARGVDAWLSWA